MGVYIMGMEMPIDGNETIIRIQPGGTVLDQYGHHLATTAVSVPPHGDLIERDKLVFEDDYYGWRDKQVVKAAPTIIPAEEGET